MSKNKNGILIKCDFCSAAAVVNFQKVWIRFTIDKNYRYREDKNFDCLDIEEPMEWDNIHVCEKHSEKWLNGEI